MEKPRIKALITSILLFIVSYIIVTQTSEGYLTYGDFSLLVPPEIMTLATWTLGVSTTVTIPIAIRSWLASKHNVLMNTGLQDMKLSHTIKQNNLLIVLKKQDIIKNYNLSEEEKAGILKEIETSIKKSNELMDTSPNFFNVDANQKKSYLLSQISTHETLKEKAERIGDIKTVKMLGKQIKVAYNELRKINV